MKKQSMHGVISMLRDGPPDREWRLRYLQQINVVGLREALRSVDLYKGRSRLKKSDLIDVLMQWAEEPEAAAVQEFEVMSDYEASVEQFTEEELEVAEPEEAPIAEAHPTVALRSLSTTSALTIAPHHKSRQETPEFVLSVNVGMRRFHHGLVATVHA